METMYYIVEKLDGDYALLKRTDVPSDTLNPVARALLPEETREGTKLKRELFDYEIVE